MKSPLFLVLILLPLLGAAQRMSVLSGDMHPLRGQKSFDIQFNYDSIMVGLQVPEKKFVADVKARWVERDSIKADQFEQMWYGDRQKYYEPAFINKFQECGIMLKDDNAKYTIVLKTRYIEGGWSVGVAGKNAEIAGELWIVESADFSHIICRIEFYDARGAEAFGGDFDMTRRIITAYQNAGKWLGIFVHRRAK